MGARTQVDVLNADVEGVSLLLENGFNVLGRVSLEGRSAGDAGATGVRVQLQSDPLIPPLAIPAAAAEADGSFSILGVTPGNYRLTVAGYRNSYLKSATIAGVDVLNGGIRLDSEPRGTLDIVLGNAPGSLDAVAMDSRKMPVAAVTVVLVPDIAQRKRYDLFRQATSDASAGSTSITWCRATIAFRLGSCREQCVDRSGFPSKLRKQWNRGSRGEGGRASADVTVIPYKVN